MSNLVKVDLEKLFSLTYTFDPLKLFLGGVQNSIEQQETEIAEFKKKIETEMSISFSGDRLNKIEEKLKSHEEEIGQGKMKMEILQSTSETHSELLKQHSNEINERYNNKLNLFSPEWDQKTENLLIKIF